MKELLIKNGEELEKWGLEIKPGPEISLYVERLDAENRPFWNPILSRSVDSGHAEGYLVRVIETLLKELEAAA